MADTYTTLQLVVPCKLGEATLWWEEVKAVMGEGTPADVSVSEGADGKGRIIVALHAET
jgi:hypothetical protein